MTHVDCGRDSVLLHLHIPKTAGMTLDDAILEIYRDPEWTEEEEGHLLSGVYYAPAGFDDRFIPDDNVRRILRRPDVRAVVGHFHFGLHEHVQKPAYYVTLLRHPVERIVSLYHHILTWENDPIRDEVIARRMTIEDFVRALGFVEVDNGQTRRIAGGDFPFGHCGRELLERAKQNLDEHFAVVGLTERFGESLVLMKHRLSWPFLPVPVIKNVNASRPRREEVPSSAVAAIRECNQLDLELYAFAESRFEEAMASQTEDFRRECRLARESLDPFNLAR